MPQAILNQILDQLQSLELAELQQLHQAVQDYLANQEEAAKRAAFHQALVASGLVLQIKQSSDKRLIKQQRLVGVRRPLVQLEGQPISETIVEERR